MLLQKAELIPIKKHQKEKQTTQRKKMKCHKGKEMSHEKKKTF